MTVIFGLEVTDVTIQENEIKSAILNNDPIDDTLHVIAVISNPCGFGRRYKLTNEFRLRMKEQHNVELYIVELAYNDQPFLCTEPKNSKHLRIRTTETALWVKENLINIGVKKLFPKKWKAMAWIDADLEFESATWALDTLKILNGCRDIVQLFSHCVDMDRDGNTMRVFTSLGYQFEKHKRYINKGNDYSHPGFAWSCTRKAWEKMGGVYDQSILGSGDFNMSLSFLGMGDKSVNEGVHPNYLQSIIDFQKRVKGSRLGYVPNVILHNFHGSKINRKYQERWKILVEHQYNPKTMITYNSDGLIVTTDKFPEQLKLDIIKYFQERLEDD
jgi:hypothetical protein